MKKIILYVLLPLLIVGCRKNTDLTLDKTDFVRSILKEKLSAEDRSEVSYSSMEYARLSNGHDFYRLTMGTEFVVVDINQQGQFEKGFIYSMSGKTLQVKRRTTFNGIFQRSNLDRSGSISYSIDEGFVKELHTINSVATNSLGVKVMKADCADCTLPEVIVSSSYSSGGISWSTWMSILAMFDMGGGNDYLSYSSGGASGGGGGSSSSVISIDVELPENKGKVEAKKYMDCFGNVPDNGTTLYTVTISADLPTDGHPEIFYNWTDRTPGHAFIELSKSTPYGSVTQNLGFYPATSYKFVTLENETVGSKLIDDGGHEYQARYTISVTAAQFQAAVNAVNSASSNYNPGLYNCTDFALDVFNAAGGSLSIPRHAIPGFEVDGGSNTPQGLYEKIKSLKDNGTANTTTTNNKEYASGSKGPCN